MLYIVVPTFNRPTVFENFISQMQRQKMQDFKIVAVDHGMVKSNHVRGWDKLIILEADSSLWWTGAINRGINYVLGLKELEADDSVLVINDDIIIDDDYLSAVVKAISKKPEACIGTVCYDVKTRKTLHVNMLLNKLKADFEYKYKNVSIDSLDKDFYESDVLKGRGTVFPVKVMKTIGIYNEIRLPHYKADHELAWRAKQSGYEVLVSKDMRIGAELNSPHRYDKRKSVIINYKSIFVHRVSTQNIKDLWNYSIASFNVLYALYYYAVNLLRSHLVFLRTVWSS